MKLPTIHYNWPAIRLKPTFSNGVYWIAIVITSAAAIYLFFHPSTVLALTFLAVPPIAGILRELGEKHKAAWVVISLALIVCVNRGLTKEHSEQIKQQAQIAESFQHIGQQISQTDSHIGQVNSQNQHEFSQTMKEFSQTTFQLARVTKLANEDMNTVTGGDSFCYAMALGMVKRDGSGSLMFASKGNYPLSDVTARTVDLDEFDAAVKQHALMTGFEGSVSLNLGNIGANLSYGPIRWPFSPPGKRYNIFFSAKNGIWSEQLRIRLVNNAWVSAVKVERLLMNRQQSKSTVVTIYQQVNPDFPRNSKGQVDW